MKKPTEARRKSNEDFFDRVYSVVARIPYGKVTTYGHIAEACGIKSAARTVGWVSGVVRKVQTGYLYHYAFAMILGLMFLLATYVLGWI